MHLQREHHESEQMQPAQPSLPAIRSTMITETWPQPRPRYIARSCLVGFVEAWMALQDRHP